MELIEGELSTIKNNRVRLYFTEDLVSESRIGECQDLCE